MPQSSTSNLSEQREADEEKPELEQDKPVESNKDLNANKSQPKVKPLIKYKEVNLDEDESTNQLMAQILSMQEQDEKNHNKKVAEDNSLNDKLNLQSQSQEEIAQNEINEKEPSRDKNQDNKN